MKTETTMNIKKIYAIVIGFAISNLIIASTITIPQEIITGFKNGSADLIAKYFDNSVELTVNSKENVYSSMQAKIILRDFFKKNPAKNFTILHQGGKGGSKYAIGNLQTIQGNYRITVLLKLNNNKTYIHQLRIEKDDI
jgi:hypothetical protein